MRTLRIAFVLVMLAAAQTAAAVNASALLGQPIRNEHGQLVGTLQDIILDVEVGRVIDLVIDGGKRIYRVPVRALGKDSRVDMKLAADTPPARYKTDSRFQRARTIIGQPLSYPYTAETLSIGTIRDIEFDRKSGEVQRVLVATENGTRAFPPIVLAARNDRR